MKTQQNRLRLLPHYFKRIGVGMTLFGLLFSIPVLFYLEDSGLSDNAMRLLRILSFDVTMSGVFVYCFAEDKVEDDLILLLRMQSIMTAFIFGVLYVMIQPLINFIFLNGGGIASEQVVFAMIIVYLAVFIYKKNKAQ